MRATGAVEGDVVARALRVRPPLSLRAVERIMRFVLGAERRTDLSVAVTFVSAARIATLNAQHLGRPQPTDVIAFAMRASPRGPHLGDVYIAPSVARANAGRIGVSPREEAIRLVIHGLLHVVGYDHPDGSLRERSPMWRRQEALTRRALRGLRR